MKYENRWQHIGSGLVILALVLLAFGSSDSGGDSGGESTASQAPDKIDAWVMAQQFVKDNLKAPGTADFGGVFNDYQDPDEVVTDLGGGKFRVRAWVDAQNAFGAKLRNHFVCELEYAGNDQWRLTSLEFAQ